MNNQRKILVIDDEIDLVNFMSTILTKEGYSVESASTVPDGKEKIAQGKYDLVISDIMLPFWGGFDLVDAVKENPDTKDTPVLVVTGMDNSVLESTHTFADACLTKPFSGIQLVDKVKELLAKPVSK